MNSWCTLFRICQQSVCVCCLEVKNNFLAHTDSNVQLQLMTNRKRLTGQCMKREKTNKMQQSDVYYQLLSQHVSGIIMPIFRRTKTVLLHMVYCSGSAGYGW